MQAEIEILLRARRKKAAEIWNLNQQIVLIGAGSPINIPGGADQCFEYRPHPEYRWLAERQRPGSVLAYDPNEGWTDFVPPVTELEQVWDGDVSIDEPYLPITELNGWLSQRAGRPVALLGVPHAGIEEDHELTLLLRNQLSHVRRPKDSHELVLLKRAASATAAGHAAAVEFIQPGVTERQIQVVLEAATCLTGADGMGYHSIVGTGSNSAVFHFTPGDRVVQSDDMVLIDAGGHVDGYVADVTRTYPASGKFTPEQQALYDTVHAALNACIEECTIGREWHDVHHTAALTMAQGMKDMGISLVSPEDLVESEAIALFFPHGVGHMVGLGVRDASGGLLGRDRPSRCCGVNVRVDLPLEEGYLMTVEPGLYFIPALLQKAENRDRFRDVLNWEVVDRWIGQGGVRLEDNILVTTDGPMNLTSDIPR
ncbi:MAG: aminopeptidase P family protein [Fimbriimonadaceae bacterium]|nr:aminopeptidase P family protein [Fimbriimonadaceae bacterium]